MLLPLCNGIQNVILLSRGLGVVPSLVWLGGYWHQIVSVLCGGGLGHAGGGRGRGGLGVRGVMVMEVRMVPGVLPVQLSQVVSVTIIAALVAPVLGVVHGVGRDGSQGRGGAGVWRGVEVGRGVGGGGLVRGVGGSVTGTRGLEWRIGACTRDRRGGGGGSGLGAGDRAGWGLLEKTLECLNVVHSLGQDIHLGHFLDRSRARNVSFEHFKAAVDSFDSVPLPGIPPGHLDVLRRRDGVPVYRVDGHKLSPGLHFRHLSRRSSQLDLFTNLG